MIAAYDQIPILATESWVKHPQVCSEYSGRRTISAASETDLTRFDRNKHIVISIIQNLQQLWAVFTSTEALWPCPVGQQKENCLKEEDVNKKSNFSDAPEMSTLPQPISGPDLV